MDNKIYFTRANKNIAANEDEIKQFEKSTLSNFSKKKEVYIIERFPKKFYYYATKIRIEKVAKRDSFLSPLSNSRLFQVFPTQSIFE